MDTLPKEVTSVLNDHLLPYKHGKRVGNYLLGPTVGEGSFAKVKEAVHIITGEKVAVKIIDKKRAVEDRYIAKNLRREAHLLQLVRHPNIVHLYEVLETDHYYYLVMEYCAGGELLDFICTKKRLEEHVTRKLVHQLVSAVDCMHRLGVVHRDLKIENFLLSEQKDLKIVDFGLSNTLTKKSVETFEQTGIFPQLLNTHCGSPAYAAPELLAQKNYGPQVDVWSIGVNMYAMLTGFLPYMMEPFNVMEMYEKMMQRNMTPIPKFVSKDCRDLIVRLLEPVPEWRITLKQVLSHRWLKDHDLRGGQSLGYRLYTKRRACERVLYYMHHQLGVDYNTTERAVLDNKAIHCSSIHHLFVQRLDRYLHTKGMTQSQIDTYIDQTTNPYLQKSVRVKKLSYQGKKISTSKSHNDVVSGRTIKDLTSGRKFVMKVSHTMPEIANQFVRSSDFKQRDNIVEQKNKENISKHSRENVNREVKLKNGDVKKSSDRTSNVIKTNDAKKNNDIIKNDAKSSTKTSYRTNIVNLNKTLETQGANTTKPEKSEEPKSKDSPSRKASKEESTIERKLSNRKISDSSPTEIKEVKVFSNAIERKHSVNITNILHRKYSNEDKNETTNGKETNQSSNKQNTFNRHFVTSTTLPTSKTVLQKPYVNLERSKSVTVERKSSNERIQRSTSANEWPNSKSVSKRPSIENLQRKFNNYALEKKYSGKKETPKQLQIDQEVYRIKDYTKNNETDRQSEKMTLPNKTLKNKLDISFMDEKKVKHQSLPTKGSASYNIAPTTLNCRMSVPEPVVVAKLHKNAPLKVFSQPPPCPETPPAASRPISCIQRVVSIARDSSAYDDVRSRDSTDQTVGKVEEQQKSTRVVRKPVFGPLQGMDACHEVVAKRAPVNEKFYPHKTIQRPKTPETLQYFGVTQRKFSFDDVEVKSVKSTTDRCWESSETEDLEERFNDMDLEQLKEAAILGRKRFLSMHKHGSEEIDDEIFKYESRKKQRSDDSNHNNNHHNDIDRLLQSPDHDEKIWTAPNKETLRLIHQLKSKAKLIQQPDTVDENNNNRGTKKSLYVKTNSPKINAITPAGKTKQLKVKQFTQFKAASKPDLVSDDTSATVVEPVKSSNFQLKPLEFNLNFRNKKKSYHRKESRSLVDIPATSNKHCKRELGIEEVMAKRIVSSFKIRSAATKDENKNKIKIFPNSKATIKLSSKSTGDLVTKSYSIDSIEQEIKNPHDSGFFGRSEIIDAPPPKATTKFNGRISIKSVKSEPAKEEALVSKVLTKDKEVFLPQYTKTPTLNRKVQFVDNNEFINNNNDFIEADDPVPRLHRANSKVMEKRNKLHAHEFKRSNWNYASMPARMRSKSMSACLLSNNKTPATFNINNNNNAQKLSFDARPQSLAHALGNAAHRRRSERGGSMA